MTNITVRDLINGQGINFDPMTLDTSELRALSESIPRDGNIDINVAEILATKFLRGSDICAELLAIATTQLTKADTECKRCFGVAATEKATLAKMGTAKMREWFANMDQDYINACNRYAELQGLVKWLNGKYDSFYKAHYMCKKLLDRSYAHESQAGWNGNGSVVKEENSGW